MEGEISGKIPYGQSLYERYFVLMNFRLEAVEFLSWWNSNLQQCFLGVNVAMPFNGLRLEYALEGSSNYIAWKDRMEVVLDDNGLKEFIEAEVPKPTDAAHVEVWQKKTAKCRRILLEGVKDHIVSSLHGKASPYLMWKALTDLFQSKSDQRKLAAQG